MGKLNRVLSAIALTVVASSPALAQAISNPTSNYLSRTNLLPITAPDDFDQFVSLSNGAFTVTFTEALTALSVPNTWQTWAPPPFSETPTPRVGYVDAMFLGINLSSDVNIFGFEAEPNQDEALFTARFFNNGILVGSVLRTINFDAGSRLLAYETAAGIDRVELSIDRDVVGFAMAQFRYGVTPVNVVPEPSTYAMMAAALAGLAVFARRRRTVV